MKRLLEVLFSKECKTSLAYYSILLINCICLSFFFFFPFFRCVLEFEKVSDQRRNLKIFAG